MPGSKIMVLGAHIGQWATLFLLLRYKVNGVILVDPNPTLLKEASDRIKKIAGTDWRRVQYIQQPHTKHWKECGVIASCAPHQFNRQYAAIAARAGAHYCDLGGHHQTSFHLAAFAIEHKLQTALCTDTGLSPGLILAPAMKLIQQGCTYIDMYCGGIPATAPDNPYRHKLMFSAAGMAAEYFGFSVQIQEGKIISPPALQDVTSHSSDLESAQTANHSLFTVQHLCNMGLRRVTNNTLRYKGHFDAIKAEPSFNTSEQAFVAWLKDEPSLRFDPRVDRDRVLIHVHGRVSADAHPQILSIELPYSDAWRAPAMGWSTGLGIALVAHQLLKDTAPQGFSVPQQWIDSDFVMSELTDTIAQMR